VRFSSTDRSPQTCSGSLTAFQRSATLNSVRSFVRLAIGRVPPSHWSGLVWDTSSLFRPLKVHNLSYATGRIVILTATKDTWYIRFRTE